MGLLTLLVVIGVLLAGLVALGRLRMSRGRQGNAGADGGGWSASSNSSAGCDGGTGGGCGGGDGGGGGGGD